ncbi:MAG: 3-deoxy-D-manno-octulosonic acid transferase [Bacteroidetes bacterium]|jgi:3-deoxy-D-manno-octulosonic-acid transferase|nr:3-deoxy-D-manno-octulosonic acid transferase [Bacteroidota bacterium]
MTTLYNLLMIKVEIFLSILKLFNLKIRKFVNERKSVIQILEKEINKNEKYIWIHVASLGEYEQGLPVFKHIKSLYKNHKIVLSFFSSSGYNTRLNNPISDITVYLPLDTSKNANKFLDIIKPEMALFVKYEFWPNFLKSLNKRGVPTYLISGVFRENHWFFKFYGFWMRKVLRSFTHFFVQNNSSKQVLSKFNINNCSVMGDSRYDRVMELLNQNNEVPYLKNFKNNKTCIVAGSTWRKDDDIIIKFINSNSSSKICWIIAPHQINLNYIKELQNQIELNSILLSELNFENSQNINLIIVDSVGILTKLYSYADISYVGGGMGKTGLHNTLEPAVHKIPVIVGQNFKNFPEVSELINLNGIISVNNYQSFETKIIELIQSRHKRDKMGKINFEYIQNNIGASEKVISYLNEKK